MWSASSRLYFLGRCRLLHLSLIYSREHSCSKSEIPPEHSSYQMEKQQSGNFKGDRKTQSSISLMVLEVVECL